MSNPFSKPASAAGIQWDSYKGRLLLIEPKGLESQIPTSFGPKDAVRADVTVIDGGEHPEEFHDALIFPGVLISQTRSLIGEKVLGRLSQGVAKPGQAPPWRIDDPSDGDVELGVHYLEHRDKKNPFATATPVDDVKAPPF